MTQHLDEEWSQFVLQLQESNQFGHPSFYASFTTPVNTTSSGQSRPGTYSNKNKKKNKIRGESEETTQPKKPYKNTRKTASSSEQDETDNESCNQTVNKEDDYSETEDQEEEDDEQEQEDEQEPLRPITKDIPPCPVIQEKDLHFSTRTQSMRVNCSLDIEHIFWNLPVIDYWKPEEGIVKKEMKQIIETKEAYDHYEQRKARLFQENPKILFREKVSKHIDNPHARKKKFKDVRKVSIGIIKRDIINAKKRDKNAFSNCFVLYLRFFHEGAYCENHVKVFNTGEMEIPGVHDYYVLETKIQSLLRRFFTPLILSSPPPKRKDALEPGIDNVPSNIDPLPPQPQPQPQPQELRFEMNSHLESKNVLINSDFNCGFYLDRKKVCQVVKGEKYGLDAFIVGDYPGVKCKFYFKNHLPFDYEQQNGKLDVEDHTMNMKALSKSPKYTVVTFTLFRTGTCLISGSCSEKMIWFVFHFVCRLLREEYLVIRSCYEDPVVKNKNHKLRKRIIKITRDYLAVSTAPPSPSSSTEHENGICPPNLQS
jgi:hypothetical protein